MNIRYMGDGQNHNEAVCMKGKQNAEKIVLYLLKPLKLFLVLTHNTGGRLKMDIWSIVVNDLTTVYCILAYT